VKKKVVSFILVCFLLLILIGFLFFKLFKRMNLGSFIKKEIIVELGNSLSIQDFVNGAVEGVSVDFDFNSFPQVGEYFVNVFVKEEEFQVKLIVVDTVSPKIETTDLFIYMDEELPKVSDFIVSIEEKSDYTISDIFLEKKIGMQEVEIVIVDEYGNVGSSKAKLFIEKDEDPPVFDGLSFLSIAVGEKLDLSYGVTAIDKRFGKVDFSYDDRQVNYGVPGTYFISYYAEDPLGNASSVLRTIEIKEKEKTYFIPSFPTFHQYPDYPNGCESVALYNLLNFYNVSVSMEEIVNKLRKGYGPFLKNGILYGGNPEVEFVGDPRNPHGYGVFQKPIIDVANYFKKGIIDFTGHSLDDVLEIVKQGIPVQVWGSIQNLDTKVCASWIDVSSGKSIDWICNLHSVVVIGFHSKSVFVSDSYTGRIEEYNLVQFEKMYNLFGRRAIYYKD